MEDTQHSLWAVKDRQLRRATISLERETHDQLGGYVSWTWMGLKPTTLPLRVPIDNPEMTHLLAGVLRRMGDLFYVEHRVRGRLETDLLRRIELVSP